MLLTHCNFIYFFFALGRNTDRLKFPINIIVLLVYASIDVVRRSGSDTKLRPEKYVNIDILSGKLLMKNLLIDNLS